MSQNLPATETPDQPDPYAQLAAELRGIADDLATLAGRGLPKPYFSMDVHPHGTGDEGVMATVDAVAGAVLGKRGKELKLSSGGYHYTAGGSRGPISISVYDAISSPAEREHRKHEAELERLRAEVAELRAAVPAGALAGDTGLAYSRDADDPTPVSPARVPLHTGAMTDSGLVDEWTLIAVADTVPVPIARHYDTSDGTSVDCACGEVFTGADADALLERHIAEGNAAASRTEALHSSAKTGGGHYDEATGLVSGGLVASCTVCGGDHFKHPADAELQRLANTVPVPAEDATLTPASAE